MEADEQFLGEEVADICDQHLMKIEMDKTECDSPSTFKKVSSALVLLINYECFIKVYMLCKQMFFGWLPLFV